MKWLPASLFLVAAFLFFIVAALKEEGAGVWIVLGCAFVAIGAGLLTRAKTSAAPRKP